MEVEEKYDLLQKILSRDIYGDRIPVKKISKIFWFNTEGAFKASVYLGNFPLRIYGKLSDQNSYILSADLVCYLVNQHVIARKIKKNQ